MNIWVCWCVNWSWPRKFLGHGHQILKTFYPHTKYKWPMPKVKNDVQDMSIWDSLQKISVKITFYFNIFKQSILDFFWELPVYTIRGEASVLRLSLSIPGLSYTCESPNPKWKLLACWGTWPLGLTGLKNVTRGDTHGKYSFDFYQKFMILTKSDIAFWLVQKTVIFIHFYFIYFSRLNTISIILFWENIRSASENYEVFEILHHSCYSSM